MTTCTVNDLVQGLLKKGADIPSPAAVHIGPEVNIDRISGKGVTIHPGCRIQGELSALSPGVELGREGPVTLENCQLGEGVELRAGYFRDSTFLEGVSAGLGAHVREGCLLEDYSSLAHCVGLKQTILFPFVTLGSLINFCDCLMAGGTGPSNHSEVGSSYIHFNFTPDGEKTTPSLIGDVPRGVMLNQPPIFLGGQGGIVGPLRVEYGTVVAAGTILRRDALEPGKLVVGSPPKGGVIDFIPRVYSGARRVVEKNIIYLANLTALEAWYHQVRRPFLLERELGDALWSGAVERIKTAKEERVKRLRAMCANMKAALKERGVSDASASAKMELSERIDELGGLFLEGVRVRAGEAHRDELLAALGSAGNAFRRPYVRSIQELSQGAASAGTRWLEELVTQMCSRAASMVPGMKLFEGPRRRAGAGAHG